MNDNISFDPTNPSPPVPQPGSSQPGFSQPNLSQPNLSQPDAASPDAAQPAAPQAPQVLPPLDTWQAPPGKKTGPGSYAFHRMFALSPKLSGLRLFFSFLLIILFMGIFMTLVDLVGKATGLGNTLLADSITPSMTLYSFISTLFSGIIPLLLAMWLVGLPLKTLLSVQGRIRWGWFGMMLLVAFAIRVIFFGPLVLAEVISGDTLIKIDPNYMTASGVIIGIIIFFIAVPLQCLSEELFCRGYLLQLCGAYIKTPVVGIIISALLFGAIHLYTGWSSAAIIFMGLVTAFLAWRTGGIEAPLALHCAKNCIAFVMALSTNSQVSQSGNAGWGILAAEIVIDMIFVGIVELLMRRRAKKGNPLTRTVEVEPRFPNVEGDPDVAALGYVWARRKWKLAAKPAQS